LRERGKKKRKSEWGGGGREDRMNEETAHAREVERAYVCVCFRVVGSEHEWECASV